MILLTLENVPYAVFNNQIECNKWLNDHDNRITNLTQYDTFEVKHIDTMDATVDYWIAKLKHIVDANWKAEYCTETKDYIIKNEIKMIKNSINHGRCLKFWLDNIYKIPSEIMIIFETDGDK